MRKIRIGNDIRLAVDLRQYIGGRHLKERDVYNPEARDFENIDNNIYVNKDYEVYYPNQYDRSSSDGISGTISSGVGIREVKAYLINTSIIEEREAHIRKKTRFIARYPIEPSFECFTSTPYNTCSSGCPTWRALPHKFCVSPYHGFGWKPEWGGIYKQVPAACPVEYCAPVMFTSQQNVIEVCFPAEAQRFTGKYKLIVVAKVYAPGFNGSNLKTVTIDMPDVLELVKTTAESTSTGIEMNVNQIEDVLVAGGSSQGGNSGGSSGGGTNTPPVTVTVDDVYVDSGSYNNNYITLTRTDGMPVGVDVSQITAWYEGD